MKTKTFLFVYVFMQSGCSNVTGQRLHTLSYHHEEQPLNLATPRATTSAAADQVKHLNLLLSQQSTLVLTLL